MPRDYSRQNLRGRSFKGQNLEGANFSYADIRGADFSGAKLKGANFSHTQAGVQNHWKIGLLVTTWLLSVLLGLITTLIGLYITNILIPQNLEILALIPWLAILVILSSFFVLTLRKSFKNVDSRPIYWVFHGAISVALSTYGSVAVAISLTAIIVAALSSTVFSKSVTFISISITATLVAALISAYSTALTLFVAGVISISSYVSGILLAAATIFGGVISTKIAGIERVGFAVTAIIMNVVAALIGLNAGWKALAGDKTWSASRTFVITVAAKFSTSFYRADLTDADFTQAKLRNANFREANITRTCWLHAKYLRLAASDITYLKDAKVCQLVTTKIGEDENFNRFDLQGINLQGANLVDTSFIGTNLNEANLQDANLSRAKLVQTQLDGTDLTGATLTGACIEDWGITSHTILLGVRCEYVFMRSPTLDDPNPRRKPDNWNETFADGDFADFIKPIVDTLDLYHNSGVDPRAIAISFKQLAENNPDAELRIVGMEVKGEDKFLLRAKTAPTADKSELSAEYFTIYNELKALAQQELKALMAEKDKRIYSLETMVKTALQSPNFYTENYHNQGDTKMSGDRTINMGSGNYNERIERDYVQGISQNMSGGTMHGGMQAAQGDRNQQTMTTHVTTSGQPPTQPEVIKMLAELEQMISDVELPLDIKEEVTMYLGAAKKAVEKEEPNKERVKANLEGVVEVLQDASQKSLVGKTVWEKTKPVLLKVTDWMGQAAAATLLAALL